MSVAPLAVAAALAKVVLLHPGGPCRSTPLPKNVKKLNTSTRARGLYQWCHLPWRRQPKTTKCVSMLQRPFNGLPAGAAHAIGSKQTRRQPATAEVSQGLTSAAASLGPALQCHPSCSGYLGSQGRACLVVPVARRANSMFTSRCYNQPQRLEPGTGPLASSLPQSRRRLSDVAVQQQPRHQSQGPAWRPPCTTPADRRLCSHDSRTPTCSSGQTQSQVPNKLSKVRCALAAHWRKWMDASKGRRHVNSRSMQALAAALGMGTKTSRSSLQSVHPLLESAEELGSANHEQRNVTCQAASTQDPRRLAGWWRQ